MFVYGRHASDPLHVLPNVGQEAPVFLTFMYVSVHSSAYAYVAALRSDVSVCF